MEYKDLINSRQSCREFDASKSISKDDLLYCLEAARLAPSACNAQPWHMDVCVGQVAKEIPPMLMKMGLNKFTSEVNCFIVVSEASYNLTAGIGSKVKSQDYKSIDIGLAVSQLCLAAEDRGVDSCILGMFDEKKLQKLLGHNNHIRLVVCLGYSVDGYPKRDKQRKDLNSLCNIFK